MNKYGKRAEDQRRSGMRTSMTMGTAGVALLAIVLLIVGLNSSAPQSFFSRSAIVIAVLLLILRQIGRRLKGKTSRAAEPDPQSKLHLD